MGEATRNGHDWALVLAAGEGSRLSSLTQRDGTAIPKQFWSLAGGRTLLGETVDRAETLVAGDRVVTVVAARHERWWRPELSRLPAANVIAQPENRGTAAGILLPLLAIVERDPEARILLLPSDHYVGREPVLRRSLAAALELADESPGSIFLLGIQPETADPDLGWIAPGRESERHRHGTTSWAIDAFVEKPGADAAADLLARRGLWNSFLLAARASALLGLFERRAPELLRTLRQARRDGAGAVDAAYERLPNLDFSRALLQGSEEWLRLLPVPHCEWSDLGTPERVARCLRRGEAEPRGAIERLTAWASPLVLAAAFQPVVAEA